MSSDIERNDSFSASADDQPNRTISLCVKSQDGKELHFKIKRQTPIRNLLAAYCKYRELNYRLFTFLYNGLRFSHGRTPEELNLNDGDEIEAMLHFNGGGARLV